MHDVIHMWAEGYNTYHLIDGYKMKQFHGGIMPDLIISPEGLNALLERVKWALLEDSLDGGLLSPAHRRIRLRGGPLQFSDGYNTEGDHLFESLSVINV
jgi:hypothetical protein